MPQPLCLTIGYTPVQETISSISVLVKRIREEFPKKGTFISIDGMDGSGKTHLAKNLALELNAFHIEFDQFLNKK